MAIAGARPLSRHTISQGPPSFHKPLKRAFDAMHAPVAEQTSCDRLPTQARNDLCAVQRVYHPLQNRGQGPRAPQVRSKSAEKASSGRRVCPARPVGLSTQLECRNRNDGVFELVGGDGGALNERPRRCWQGGPAARGTADRSRRNSCLQMNQGHQLGSVWRSSAWLAAKLSPALQRATQQGHTSSREKAH
jgi:hypothetical protein